MEKLAIFGGTPVRSQKIFYGRQWVDEADIEAVSEVLRSDYLTCGPQVSNMEKALCDYTGAEYAVAVSNGTAALHCACIAADIGPGDEVITTPITFAASANCALYCGAHPVFADINAETYNIDPESIRKCITERTKAVVAVDFTGQVVEYEAIRAICGECGLIFIEDAAHSIGTKYNGKQVGSLADMTTFSFHPVKTNNGDFYQKLVLAHAHGITHDEKLMEEAPHEGPWYYEEISMGYNFRITDLQAALIVSQMNKLDKFIARRKEIVKAYNEAFSYMPEIFVQKEIPQSDTCRHLYIIQLRLNKLSCTRREFFDALSAENVQCQIHYVPVYWFPYYKRLGYNRGLCPNAEKMYEGIMSLPLFPKMSNQDVEDVIKAVKKVVGYYRK